MSRLISQAAVSISYFEKSRIYRGQAEIRLSDKLRHHAAGRSFLAVGVTTTVRNYTLANVVLEADTGLLYQDRTVIPETAYFEPARAGGDWDKDPEGMIRLDETEDVVIGSNNAHHGYQHWLTQCVPAIDWSLRQQRTRKVRLVLPALAPWQEDILEILGYRDVPRFTPKPGTFYRLPRAEYSEFLNGRTSFGICMAARETARRILERLPSHRSPHPVLFVQCSNPYYGTVRNEAEIIDVLRRRGVYVVPPGLSTAERINLFRHADVVIGPLGERLADIVFCKPGAVVWEWMPEHHQNASFNRLAQAAGVDYWGDMFASAPTPAVPGGWVVDADIVVQRLAEISQHLARRAAGTEGALSPAAQRPVTGKPIDELMLAFESLGDNCEFGLVQRYSQVEPLGLLRFAGMHLANLITALHTKFGGLGTADTVIVYPSSGGDRRELMVHETSLDTRYHTWILEGDIDPEELRQREAKRLNFLRRKLLDDLAVGEKIWVWREFGMTDRARIEPLMDALRSLGPNTLLWVVAADDEHPIGTVERLDRDFLKGYVERLAPYNNATDICHLPWFEMCQNAFDLCYPDLVDCEEAPPEPAETIAAAPSRPLSAMEFLMRNQSAAQPASPAPFDKRQTLFARLWRSMGF